MAQTATAPKLNVTEKTFSAYNRDQGKAYADTRRDYHQSVYQTVIDHHKSTGGQFDSLVDLGCGPGNVARALAPYFKHATGFDPSQGMIATAQSLGGKTSTCDPIVFAQSTAEDIGTSLSPPIENASVDLITAGNAAHWFDMTAFWPRAAQVLKPGGSVAFWTSGPINAHPSMPNAEAIQKAMDQLMEQHLRPYRVGGNDIVHGRYVDLLLPWTVGSPVPDFDEATFCRKEWDVSEPFYAHQSEVDLDMFEKMMGTGSPVVRWRQAHPDAIGTEHDVLRILRREIERLLHEAGVKVGEERLKGALPGVILIVKKKV